MYVFQSAGLYQRISYMEHRILSEIRAASARVETEESFDSPGSNWQDDPCLAELQTDSSISPGSNWQAGPDESIMSDFNYPNSPVYEISSAASSPASASVSLQDDYLEEDILSSYFDPPSYLSVSSNDFEDNLSILSVASSSSLALSL